MKKIILICAFILMFLGLNAQISFDILNDLKNGNSKELSKHFNQNIEITILDIDNVYSKAQAEQVINNFFNRYKPTNFVFIHSGGKDGEKEDIQYFIGNLYTNRDIFRVYFLIKNNIIHQFKIEKI